MPWWFWIIVGLMPAVAIGLPVYIQWLKRRGGEK